MENENVMENGIGRSVGVSRGFSIGICASDSAPQLRELIARIQCERFPSEYTLEKIIVVASGCSESPLSSLRKLSKSDERLLLIEEAMRQGKTVAINKIASAYSGDFLVMVNGDAMPDAGAITRLLLAISRDEGAGMVAGRPIFQSRGDFLSRVLELMWTTHNDCAQRLNHAGVSNQCSDEMMVARAEVVRRLPQGVVNDGAYLAGAAFERGYTIKFCSEAPVRIDVPRRAVDLIQQRRRILFGHFQVWRLLGRPPKTLEMLLVTSPSTSLKILMLTLARVPRLILALPIAIVVEFASVSAAIFDSLRSTKSHVVWKRHGS